MKNHTTNKSRMGWVIQNIETLDTSNFLKILVGYVLLHALLRLLFSPVLGTDDVIQAIYAQRLSFDYELRQPPLFSWLQWGCDQLVGVGVHSHIILKYSLLFITYFFLYLSGCIIYSKKHIAALAALSLWLTYPFAVSIHQGVTHSVLMSALIAITFYAFIKLEQKPSSLGYLGLGLWIGLGIFSKYGFIIFATSFVVAALSIPRFRRVLMDRRILLTILVITAIAALPLSWLYEHRADATKAVSSLGPQNGVGTAVQLRVSNLASLGSAIIQFLAPLWIFLLIFFPKAFKRIGNKQPEHDSYFYQQLIGRAMFIALGLVVVAMTAGLMGKVTARWMHPFLLLFPLYFFVRAEQAYPEGILKSGFLSLLVTIPILVIALWAGQTYLGPSFGKNTRFNAPYDLFVDFLRKENIKPGMIVASDEYLAGNLRLGFPETPTNSATLTFNLPAKESGICLLAWQKENDLAIPENLTPYLVNREAVGQAQIQLWKHNYRHSYNKSLEIAYLVLPPANCKTP